MRIFLAISVAALFPLAIGPLPTDDAVLVVALCNGGSMSIPLGGDKEEPAPCPAKGCHAGPCRKQIDPAQRRAR